MQYMCVHILFIAIHGPVCYFRRHSSLPLCRLIDFIADTQGKGSRMRSCAWRRSCGPLALSDTSGCCDDGDVGHTCHTLSHTPPKLVAMLLMAPLARDAPAKNATPTSPPLPSFIHSLCWQIPALSCSEPALYLCCLFKKPFLFASST